MNMVKKSVSILLAVIMVISVFTIVPITAYAEETVLQPVTESVNVVLVDGQSNAAGTAGTLDGAEVEMPAVGDAFLWEGVNATQLVDLNTYVTNKVANNSKGSVGFHPALAKKLTEKTGLKTVVIHAGYSGQSISVWNNYKTNVTNAINNCLQAIEAKGYTVANKAYVWLQGESDACATYAADYCYYRTLEEYYNLYLPVHEAYLNALGDGAVGGIVTVQTRQQLNSGVSKASEYCGVRAAQQALANQNNNLHIVSEITDAWRVSTDKEKFSTQGGYIHYSQTGYNLIGADAGENLAKTWSENTPVNDFELVRNDAVICAEDSVINVSDTMRDIHTENTSERGAAQLVVKPYPLYADCSVVTMTLTGEDNTDYSNLITDNGFIASAKDLPESATLKVTADGVTKTYTLKGLPKTTKYFWDFTDESNREDNVLHAVTEDGWNANDVTYQGTMTSLDSAEGFTKNGNAGNYFELAEPITLSANSPWTIEWNGKMSTASISLSNWENNTRKEHVWYDGNGVMHVRQKNGSSDIFSFDMKDAASKDATWYMIHDGKGSLTVAAVYNGQLLMKKAANVISEDYHVSAILGHYDTSSNFNYKGSVRSMKVYDGAAVLPVTVNSVAITVPDMDNAPVTEVSGEHFTGTVTWTPDDEVFADGVAYTANVTLVPEEGFYFADTQDVTVAGAQVSDLNVTAETITFKAAFPAVIGKYNYYWKFTDSSAVSGNTFSAYTAEGEDWVGNDLTYSKDSITVNSTTGVGGANGYFTMAKPVYLSPDEPWYIEWNGKSAPGSFVMSHPDTEKGSDVAGADYVFMTKNQGDQFKVYLVPGGNAGANNVANLPLGESTAHDGVFYIAHDGNGKVTMGCYENGELTKIEKANAITKGWTFDTLLGYYKLPSPAMLYGGTMKYMKVRHDNLLLNDIAVSVAAPAAYAQPQTAIDGEGYTGTVTWNPVAQRFAASTEYSAHVVLTAEDGNIFGRGFNVTAAAGEMSNLEITDETVSFDLAFGECPGLKNYYWDFTDTNSASSNRMSAVEDSDWSANTLTYLTTKDVAKNVTLNATNGISNSGAYFVPDENIYLPKNTEWTIEWQGSITASSIMMAYNTTGTPLNQNQLYITNDYPKGYTGVFFYPIKSSCSLQVPIDVGHDADTHWYIMNDGTGNITLTAIDKNGVAYSNTAGKQSTDLIEFNKIFGCFNMGTTDRRAYSGSMKYLLITRSYDESGVPAAELNGVKYISVNDAVEAAAKNNYADGAPAETSVIKLLRDAQGGFDVGVETNDLATFKTQNIELDLDGHTLSLGYPSVGSSTVGNKGIRVLANSKLVVKNGILDVTDEDVTRGMNNYGECELDSVSFTVSDSGMDYTVRNRGVLTLSGNTSIPGSGNAPALIVEPYEYSYTANENAIVNCSSGDVAVGDIVVKLNEIVHHTSGAVNSGVPEMNISAGSFGKITETGDAKTPVGNIFGGTFDAKVPANLCAEDYIPTEADENGKYTVEPAVYVAEMTVNGVTTKYLSINDAIAAAPVKLYSEGKAGQEAEKASIKLLMDTQGGFDIGVETNSLSTFKIQNIELDLDGHTLTLGQPLVGSTGTKTNGIRVLAYSKFNLKNGTVSGMNSGALRGLQNYGESTLDDVTFTDMSNTYDAIGNFGALTLSGDTKIPNGSNSAILNSTYLYSDDSQVPVQLTVSDDTVSAGIVRINLKESTHPQTGNTNESNPVIEISGGEFEKIYTYNSDKTLEGGVRGGTFDEPVPENCCAEGYVPTEADESGKYTVKPGEYVAQIGDVKYETVADALAAVPTGNYPNTPAEATTIKLLKDVSTGFDIGVETNNLATFKTQNVIFDLDGHTMTLGHPTVGSTGTQTQGIRVLAFSKLNMLNGSLAVDTTAARVTIANYGELKLTDVNVGTGTNVLYTINNCGNLTLDGTTTVENGTQYAIVNGPYLYPSNENINVVMNVDSENVKVNGDILVELDEVVHPSTHAVNEGVPEMNISAGTFGKLIETGDAKTPVGNISGGTFDAKVPENLCAEGYIPTEADEQGKYTVIDYSAIDYKANLSLAENIIINFYVRNLPKNTDLNNYRVEYTFKGETEKASLYDFNHNAFVVAVCAAKDMTEDVSLKVYYGDTLLKEVNNYSVQTYCENKINDVASTEELKDVCYAVLSYGSSAQEFFNYNTDKPADANYKQGEYSGEVPDQYKAVSVGKCNAFVRANLTLETETELHFYFKPKEEAELTYTFRDSNGNNMLENENVTINQVADGYTSITVSHIAAKELNQAYTLELNDGTNTKTVTYSPLSYAYSKQSVPQTESVARQLYHYWETAKAYFDSEKV